MKSKWLTSLQAKYLFLILIAILVLPVSIPVTSGLVYVTALFVEDPEDPYGNYSNFQEKWEKEVEAMDGLPADKVSQHLESINNKWPDTGMIWVDKSGEVKEKINSLSQVPEHWSRSYTVKFMKDHYDSDPFTVVSPLGKSGESGLMIVQIDRKHLGPPITKLRNNYDFIFIILTGLIMIGFGLISWFFFKKVHGRLTQLKVAMEQRSINGLPTPVERTANDEIGELESSFNRMVKELEESRKREQQEEAVRREWIASLSHDLRTPLTTIRASLAEVTAEVSSPKSKDALDSVNEKIDSLSTLIDNLLSLTLLTSKKYPYQEEQIEMNRFIRQMAAHWYSTFEQNGVEVTIDNDSKPVYWTVDPKWMERIIDNLLQNVLRHALGGKFVGLSISTDRLAIRDCGPGLSKDSPESGAGIGLTIVDVMVKDMGLEWRVNSSPQGTEVVIQKPLKEEDIGQLA